MHRMGFLLSKSMDQSLQKQQEFMLISGRMQMERQMLMQNEMRERQTAMQIAWSREFLKAVRQRRAVLLAPVVPLSFILAYQMDMAYGSLIHRMRGPWSVDGGVPFLWSLRLDAMTSDRRKRNFSLGLAGMCCNQGCTKNDIGRLC
ncbi:plasminogen receptor (KT) isoform X3 [Pimephales promelas]|uniref:plasminogen receptor (KT) isoform X3 n=1 Tax=Pimephales promelas TaxID=90988 RepID=UPI001955B1EA|nr:plasminogen receptor (KT) isoform X3 [Pimephales promelas]